MDNGNENGFTRFVGNTISLLLTAFVTLRLCGVIEWPWFWVLSPITIPAAALLVMLVVSMIIGAVKHNDG